MKSKFTLFAVATTVIFTSCSKEANFSNSGTSFGGFHKTETTATAQVSAEENTLTASAEAQPVIADKTVAFSAPKAAKTEVNTSETTEAAVATAAATMTKKEVKAVAKQIKKETKKANTNQAGGKSQVIALILALLVGIIGIHRFYLGYTGIGIAQLLTLGGCGIWSLIDLVRIITGDLQPKDGSYEKTL